MQHTRIVDLLMIILFILEDLVGEFCEDREKKKKTALKQLIALAWYCCYYIWIYLIAV